MAIARRRTNKKNNIRRKSRAVVKRGGARKMTQKGGMEDGGGGGAVDLQVIVDQTVRDRGGTVSGETPDEVLEAQVFAAIKDPPEGTTGNGEGVAGGYNITFDDQTKIGDAITVNRKLMTIYNSPNGKDYFNTLFLANQIYKKVIFDGESISNSAYATGGVQKYLTDLLRILFIIKTEVPGPGEELFDRYFTQSGDNYQLSVVMRGEVQERLKFRLVNAGKKYAKLLSLLIEPAGVVGFRVDDGEAFASEILRYLEARNTVNDTIKHALTQKLRASGKQMTEIKNGLVDTIKVRAEKLYRNLQEWPAELISTRDGRVQVAAVVASAIGAYFGTPQIGYTLLGLQAAKATVTVATKMAIGLGTMIVTGATKLGLFVAGTGIKIYVLVLYLVYVLDFGISFALIFCVYLIRKKATTGGDFNNKVTLFLTWCQAQFGGAPQQIIIQIIRKKDEFTRGCNSIYTAGMDFFDFYTQVVQGPMIPIVILGETIYDGISSMKQAHLKAKIDKLDPRIKEKIELAIVAEPVEGEVIIEHDELEGVTDTLDEKFDLKLREQVDVGEEVATTAKLLEALMDDPTFVPSAKEQAEFDKEVTIAGGGAHSGGARKLVKVRGTRKNSRSKSNKNKKKNTKRRRARK